MGDDRQAFFCSLFETGERTLFLSIRVIDPQKGIIARGRSLVRPIVISCSAETKYDAIALCRAVDPHC